MSLVINTNIYSLEAQNNLNATSASLNSAVEDLSSGLKINSAADDAAGYAIATRLTAQINGANQAIDNSNNGISLAQTAEGALSAITNDLQRIRQLAVESANGTNSSTDQAALNTEAQSLISEINRQASVASFNGVNLFDGSNASINFQVGGNTTTNNVITVSGFSNLTSAGTLGGTSIASTNDTAAFSAGTTALQAATTASGGEAADTATGLLTVTGNGVTVDVSANGFAAASSVAARQQQVVAAINGAYTQTGVGAYVSAAGNIILSSASSFTIGGTDTGAVTGVVGASGAVTASTTIDPANVTATVTNPINNYSSISLTSAIQSELAINSVDAALTSINTLSATLGATQNRFTSVVSSLTATAQNLTSARSTIQDADFAAETADFTQAQILQQSGTAVLAQANSIPKNVLTLLQNL